MRTVYNDAGIHWRSRWVSDWPAIIRSAWRAVRPWVPRAGMLETPTHRGIVIAWPKVNIRAMARTLAGFAYTAAWIGLTLLAIHNLPSMLAR